MKIAVLGAGAIGAYVGAKLARAGADVALIARGAHCEAMRSNGVRVTGDGDTFVVRPPVTDDPGEVGEVDAVFLSLKAHQYAGSAPLLEPLLGPSTSVVTAQNGIPWWYFHGTSGAHRDRRIESVDPDGSVSAVIPAARVLGCVVYSSTELEEPGVVRFFEGKRFPVGEPDGTRSERCEAVSGQLRMAGLKAPVVEDIREQIWLKLMGNAVFNPLSALTGATMAQICRFPATRATARQMMSEIVEVAGAYDVTPPFSVDRRLAGAEAVGDHKTSMLQDLEAGKDLELDAILGAVVELAELVSVDVPCLRTVHSATALLAERRRNSHGSS